MLAVCQSPPARFAMREAAGLALRRLSDRERRAVTLRNEGATFDEVGHKLGNISHTTARLIVIRAHRKMRYALRDLGVECLIDVWEGD